jgi:hypothetical protein
VVVVPALVRLSQGLVECLGALAQAQQGASNARDALRRGLLRSDPLGEAQAVAQGVQRTHDAPQPTLPQRHARRRVAPREQRQAGLQPMRCCKRVFYRP